MIWIIVAIGIFVLIFILGSAAEAVEKEEGEKKKAALIGIYPTNLKTILSEEFPSASDIMTTTFCSGVLSELIKYAQRTTRKKDPIDALVKLSTNYEKARNQQKIDNEIFKILTSKFPQQLRAMLNEEMGRDRFQRSLEAAMNQSVAEVSR